jgi:6-pyruvoyl-tetrahydropterin synthase
MQRILLGQLGANGDCLYTTILAHQIRHDNPDAHITWAISSQCAGLLRGNPHIDEVWQVPVPPSVDQALAWRVFEREACRRLLRHEFDHAYLSQIWPNNFQNYDGTIRPSILRAYCAPITVPISNTIVLDQQERERVAAFIDKAGLKEFEHRILFECSAKSGQSFMTPALAEEVADYVYDRLPESTIVFSTHLPMALRHKNSRYAGTLTLREIAALTHDCTLFVGTGSGGTVAASSTAAKWLPMIQLLSASTSMYASFRHDFEYYGLPSSNILEMTNESPAHIASAIAAASASGIEVAKAEFDSPVILGFRHYMELIEGNLLNRDRYLDAAQSLLTTVDRYGWHPQLREFGLSRLAPNLASDPGWLHAHRRQLAEVFMGRIQASESKSEERH